MPEVISEFLSVVLKGPAHCVQFDTLYNDVFRSHQILNAHLAFNENGKVPRSVTVCFRQTLNILLICLM